MIDDLLHLLAEEPGDELSALLVELRWLALKYPRAARAAVRALAAEGRRFAATEEGARWKRRLAASELVRRGQPIWEIATANALDTGNERPGELRPILPSDLLDALSRAVARDDLEPALARAIEPPAREAEP